MIRKFRKAKTTTLTKNLYMQQHKRTCFSSNLEVLLGSSDTLEDLSKFSFGVKDAGHVTCG